MTSRRLRVVVYKTNEGWLGVCLEHCFIAQADSHSEILSEVHRVVIAHAEIAQHLGEEPFAALPPAPTRFWHLYDDCDPRQAVEQIIQLPEGPRIALEAREPIAAAMG